jgi:signal transduction histidine kinase
VVTDAIRAVLAEPAAPSPPGPQRRDWLLVAAIVAIALVEGALSPDVVWRPVAIVVCVALAFLLPWRRTHPLAVVSVAFATCAALHVASVAADVESPGLMTQVYFLLLTYSLFRWASGRDMLTGAAIVVVAVALTLSASVTGTDILGAAAVVLTSMAVGACVRSQVNARARELEQIKLLEREQLARELHDTVAHHVSAIAIQAQAGRTVAPREPGAAVAALEVIEGAAIETLADMRAMVRILRDARAAELAPLGGVADIARLGGAGGGPRIDVELAGEIADLPPSIDAAAYRLAQESITNAVRHARDATCVRVRVATDATALHLRVHDDGDTTHIGASRPSGFGLVGMAERARLLGGTCEAGPDPAGGWTVTAVLPRNGTAV